MTFQGNLLNKLIGFFGSVNSKSANILYQLKLLKYEIEFGERDDDIYVATYHKSGTTWMQQILYQLTTAGEMSFNHIYDVSPWVRYAAENNRPLPQVPSPRIIKTHDAYNELKSGKKGKFIYVVRSGLDVGLSLFHHEKNYNKSQLDWEELFVSSFVKPWEKNWFEFNANWLQNSNKLPILYVRYEDLKSNFVLELYRIAAFLAIKINENDLARIVERSSFEFMKLHESKFGEQPSALQHTKVYDQFIRSGNVGEGKQHYTNEQLRYYASQFNQNLAGFKIMEGYKSDINEITDTLAATQTL